MTSNGDTSLNSPSLDRDPPRETPSRTAASDAPESSTAAPAASTADCTTSKTDVPAPDALRNGINAKNEQHNDIDDAANESEAETVVLGHRSDEDEDDDKLIKKEHTDDDDDDYHDSSPHARRRSVQGTVNGRSSSRDRTNGAKHGSDRDAKSPVPTSPSSRTASRHTKDTSPSDSVRSHPRAVASPTLPSGRGRSASTADSRKRKARDDLHARGLEPPRQKAKIESLRDVRQATSPATPGLGRPHKRSQSTQSLASGVAGRKRKDMTSLAVKTDRKNWSDDSSENSSSPRRLTHTPHLPPHGRVKRAGRALTSPARTMAHGRKVDKFGATRLARESEKGELASVQAAYEAAPDELDQGDFAGIAPLQKAALNGWTEVVAYLIKKGCRTDCKSDDLDTPLIDAVENGHLDVVKLLLGEGRVNPHHQNKKGQRAIDVLDPEVDDAEDIEKELKAAMRREVNTLANDEQHSTGVTQTKSASRLLYNEYNTETLIEKAGDGDILAVGELINSNIRPNIACGVAASRGGHYDILSILLASGLKVDPDPSKHSETPMLVAIGRGHLKIVNLLLEQDNFDPTRRNREGKTYWQISEDRRGPKWEQERDMLKQAYETFKLTRKSPKRTKKEPPHAARMKRKSSPMHRERSSSPRPEPKRVLTKSTTVPQAPQKSRRLMSGKEMANREVKRRRNVVSDESSEDDSEDEVRPPKKTAQPRSYSEGEEHQSVKRVKAREEHDSPKRIARAVSHDSDHERPKSKIRTKTEKVPVKSRIDTDSGEERRIKNKIKSRLVEEHKPKKRRPSNDSLDERARKTPNTSAKSTPAPPEVSTPDAVRERRLEEQKAAEKQAEMKKKAAAEAKKREDEAARKREEDATRKREEDATRKREEEAARKIEEEAAKKAAEEEEARKKAEAEAEAKRAAEEAEAARKREEEEKERREAEEAKRQEELAARKLRVESLPRALRRACELGNNRPLHFAGEELGVSAVFLPLFHATSTDLKLETKGKLFIPSFQVVGILGLPELDLSQLGSPYDSWRRIPFTSKHRDILLRQYDVALLAQDYRFPMEGAPDFDYTRIQESIKEARQQFLNMEGLYWVEDEMLYPEVEKLEHLHPLLHDIKDVSKRRRLHLADAETHAVQQKKPKPRKSFMDMVLAQNKVDLAVKVNGEG